MSDLIRLRDAGHREQAWARQLVDEKRLPSGLDFAALMEHAMYDARRDEVVVTVKAATLRYRVRRA